MQLDLGAEEVRCSGDWETEEVRQEDTQESMVCRCAGRAHKNVLRRDVCAQSASRLQNMEIEHWLLVRVGGKMGGWEPESQASRDVSNKSRE